MSRKRVARLKTKTKHTLAYTHVRALMLNKRANVEIRELFHRLFMLHARARTHTRIHTHHSNNNSSYIVYTIYVFLGKFKNINCSYIQESYQ